MVKRAVGQRVLRVANGTFYVTPPPTATAAKLKELEQDGDGLPAQPLLNKNSSGWCLGEPKLIEDEGLHHVVGVLKRSKRTKIRWTVVPRKRSRHIADPSPSPIAADNDASGAGGTDSSSVPASDVGSESVNEKDNDESSWLVNDDDSDDIVDGSDDFPTGCTTDSEAAMFSVAPPQVDRMLRTALSANLLPHVVREIMAGTIHHIHKSHNAEEGVCWACQRQRMLRFVSAVRPCEPIYMGRSCASKVRAAMLAMRALRRAQQAMQAANDLTQSFIEVSQRVVREYMA